MYIQCVSVRISVWWVDFPSLKIPPISLSLSGPSQISGGLCSLNGNPQSTPNISELFNIQSLQHLLLTTSVCAPGFGAHVDRHKYHPAFTPSEGRPTADNWET